MEWLTSIGSWVLNNGALILEILGAFAILARFTPNTTDDKIIQHVLDGINFMGMNHGKAKNA
jgi:hypothetical protein